LPRAIGGSTYGCNAGPVDSRAAFGGVIRPSHGHQSELEARTYTDAGSSSSLCQRIRALFSRRGSGGVGPVFSVRSFGTRSSTPALLRRMQLQARPRIAPSMVEGSQGTFAVFLFFVGLAASALRHGSDRRSSLGSGRRIPSSFIAVGNVKRRLVWNKKLLSASRNFIEHGRGFNLKRSENTAGVTIASSRAGGIRGSTTRAWILVGGFSCALRLTNE